METSTSKKLVKRVNTVCDYNIAPIKTGSFPTEGTDPTTITATTIITTINTHVGRKS
ncbi:hypothetical protein [Mucilaginibacter conchicola]|uniref:hypothetical protein n=1 Tax=Mucilaginibacter conchicola TaxID=2303333 RepID=UPI0013145569|nr:hypothetical protein [Mucilaginibacter conchicola]